MLGFQFIKFDAATHVILYKNGAVLKEGRGLSFWYFEPNSSIVAIPTVSNDASFIFEETSSDFQTVTIQGQITYQVQDPTQLAQLLDFTVNARKQYKSDDPEKLIQRLINEAQAALMTQMENLTMKEAIRSSKILEQKIMQSLQNSPAVMNLGVVPLSVNILAIKPNPEMARALEAETREALQQDADEAVYSRRKFAVEQERTIKESELNTEIAVEVKRKQITQKKMETDITKSENSRKLREMKISADIAIENEKQELIDLETLNQKKQADINLYKLQKTIEQYKQLDWKTLMALNGNGDAKQQIALAFRELAENAGKIGTLNITPDTLELLLGKSSK